MPSDELARLRRRIDSIDRRVGALLARRFELAVQVKTRGLRTGRADPQRERRVLRNASAAAGCAKNRAAVRAVYLEVLRQAKRLQGC